MIKPFDWQISKLIFHDAPTVSLLDLLFMSSCVWLFTLHDLQVLYYFGFIKVALLNRKWADVKLNVTSLKSWNFAAQWSDGQTPVSEQYLALPGESECNWLDQEGWQLQWPAQPQPTACTCCCTPATLWGAKLFSLTIWEFFFFFLYCSGDGPRVKSDG